MKVQEKTQRENLTVAMPVALAKVPAGGFVTTAAVVESGFPIN